MAMVEIPRGHGGPEAAAELLLDIHPQENGGVLFDSVVTKRETLDYDESKVLGSLTTELTTYSDGVRRITVLAEPDVSQLGRAEISQVPLVGTMPWTISAKGGLFLKEFVKPAVKAGYPVLLVSHEGEGEAVRTPRTFSQWRRYFKVLSGIQLGRTAHHIHATLDSYASQVDFDAATAISVLDSEGAMTTFGTVAQAEANNRHIPYFDTMDPCRMAQVIRSKERGTLRKVPKEEAMGVVKLGIEVGSRAVRHLSLKELREYKKTINLHPLSLLGELAYIPALASEETADMAAAMPAETRGTVTYLEGSSLSKAAQESTMLDGFDNIRQLFAPGPHTFLAKRSNQRNRISRLARLRQEMVRTNYEFGDINWNKLYLGAVALQEE